MFSQAKRFFEGFFGRYLMVAVAATAALLLAGCSASTPKSGAAMTDAAAGGGRVLKAQDVQFKQIAPFVKMGGAGGNMGKGATVPSANFPAAHLHLRIRTASPITAS